MEIAQQIDALIQQSTEEDYGDNKVNLLKEAVKLADTAQIEPLAFISRVFLMEACVFSGYSELALIHFPWIESTYRKNPDVYDLGSFNWMYSWVVILMSYSPNIRLTDIEAVMERLTDSYHEQGKSARTLYEIKRTVATILGQYDKAAEYQQLFAETRYPGDWYYQMGVVNHRAIELHNESYYLTRIGKLQEAREVVRPILEGKLDFPLSLAYTLSATMVLLIRLGEWEEAERHFPKALKMIRRQRKYKNLQPDLLIFTALRGDFTLAANLFEEMVPILEASPIGLEQFEHCRAARLLFAQMAAKDMTDVKLKLPEYHPCFQTSQSYSPPLLEAYYHKMAQDWATRFDERNGNDTISQLFQQSLELGKYAKP